MERSKRGKHVNKTTQEPSSLICEQHKFLENGNGRGLGLENFQRKSFVESCLCHVTRYACCCQQALNLYVLSKGMTQENKSGSVVKLRRHGIYDNKYSTVCCMKMKKTFSIIVKQSLKKLYNYLKPTVETIVQIRCSYLMSARLL